MAVLSIIPTSEMTERFDAEFYTPNFLVNDKKLKSMPHEELSEILQNLQLGYTGPTEKFYEIDGINYLSSKNIIDGNIVITDATDTISTYAHKNDLKKTAVQEGDVLISRTGNVGKSAIVTRHLGEANIAAHLIALRIKKGWDSYYLSAFLNSFHGRQQSQRHQRGTIIQGLSVYDVPLFYIPIFSKITQKYIGDKVRQAEELRNWAKITETSVRDFHVQFIPEQENLNFNKKTRLLSTNKMTERLDAHFYPGVVEEDLKLHPNSFKSLESLTTDIYNGQTQSETKDECCLQITVTNLSSSFIKGQPRQVECPAKNNKFIKPHDILMCNAAHNKVYIGRELTYVHTNERLLPSTEVMTIRINREIVPASYVRTYLESKLGYVKIQSTIRGITAHSYPDDMKLLDIYIPEIPSDQKEAWFNQDALLIYAGNATEYAYYLTTVAKLLVEALIEGQLTEEQLIQAQQALEDGDNTLDKAILNKLSSEGYAVEGAAPLFSDVDELYSLLASATAADSED